MANIAPPCPRQMLPELRSVSTARHQTNVHSTLPFWFLQSIMDEVLSPISKLKEILACLLLQFVTNTEASYMRKCLQWKLTLETKFLYFQQFAMCHALLNSLFETLPVLLFCHPFADNNTSELFLPPPSVLKQCPLVEKEHCFDDKVDIWWIETGSELFGGECLLHLSADFSSEAVLNFLVCDL